MRPWRCATSTGVQVALHADSLNEAGFVQNTLAATMDPKSARRREKKYRSLHVFHVEGAGGGHAPDMISLVGRANVLPASTNPTRPLTFNTVKEHIDMMIVCHHLNPEIEADMAFADSRIRPSTMAAEDLLHDMGAISMMSSDAQAMGRIGEMIMRTWQTAHVMKARYGHLDEDTRGGQLPCPAVHREVHHQPGPHPRHRHEVGSVEQGKLADLVLWEPKFFGVKPHMVIKGGQIAYAQIGDANASIPTPQPFLPRPVWGSCGRSTQANSFNFVPELALNGELGDLGLVKPLAQITQHPEGDEGRHEAQQRSAGDRHRSRHLRRQHRRRRHLRRANEDRRTRRGPHLRDRTAHGPAVLPVLTDLF